MNQRSALLAAAALALSGPCLAMPAVRFTRGVENDSGIATPGHSVDDQGSGAMAGAPQGPGITIIAPMAADSDGKSVSKDGSHQDKTSLMPGGQALNADQVCYVVLPLKQGWKCYDELQDVKLGDLVKISFQGKVIYGIAGDKGPGDASKFGEASLACIKQLGQDPKGGTTGLEGQAFYTFYPGSGNGAQPGSNQEIMLRLASMSSQAGQGQAPQVQQASGNAKPYSQCSGGSKTISI